MRTRLVSVLLCLACTGGLSCLRSLDAGKVPCTTSLHCPSHYMCQEGFCRPETGSDSGTSSDGPSSRDGSPALKGDTATAASPDASTISASPDAPISGTGGAGGASTTAGATSTAGAGGQTGSAGTAATASMTGLAGSTAAASTTDRGGTTSVDGGAAGTVAMTSSSAGAGGASGSGGVSNPGGSTAVTSSSSTPVAGSTGSGGKGGASGGAITSSTASGGAATAGAGGTSTASSATCQPKPRDCTSTLDNNCNGIPDNQETTACACPVGQKRDCQDPYNAVGICKKNTQVCSASSDKTTSSWSECSGGIAPSPEVCDAAGLDENCNGQSNEGCECVNGTSIPCDCGSPTTCTNGKKGTCSVTKVTMYLDSDKDGYGDSARPAMVCPGDSRYVSNANDCDDGPNGASFYPSVYLCTSVTERKWCPNTGGVAKTEPCDQGCLTGTCRHDGTIGVPGYVSCTATHLPKCAASAGCDLDFGTCGTGSGNSMYCDGPGDCGPDETCCVQTIRGGAQAVCMSGSAPCNVGSEVCDPLANTCTCTSKDFNGYTFSTCP